MQKSNFLKLFIKVAFACMVFIAAAKSAFAQVTLDLNVLLDEFPPKETSVKQKEELPLKSPETTVKKTAPVKKTMSVKKAVPPKKPVPAKKAVVKKPKPASKPVVKKKNKPTEKYRVKETGKKDEHDKLKPIAAPVPEIKVLATSASTDAKEMHETDTAEKTDKNETPQTEPKISKHFLEQKQLKENVVSTEKTSVISETPSSEPEKTIEVSPIAQETKTEKHLPASKNEPENKHRQVEKPTVLDFSVFPVSDKLTQTERSVELSKELPQESTTIKALSDAKKTLLHIFIFAAKSVDLTDEMQNTLDSVAETMQSDRNKRLILYAYSKADSAEPGKERQYALRRALMIRSYLITRGIHSLRIGLRSQGSKGAGDKIPDRTDLVFHEK